MSWLSLVPRVTSALLLVLVTAFAAASPAVAGPAGGDGSASAVIDGLKAQGYDVQINWLTGYDTKPLSQCRVVGINDPNSSPPDGTSLHTVYVDVRCPNTDDGGFTFGGGLGAGPG